MKIEYYRNYVKIVEAGTITAASKLLLIAQPALSNQLKTLEKVYGAQLLVRNPRCLTLTDAGKILYDKAKTIISLEDIAKMEISSCTQGLRGTLWLGLSATWPDNEMVDVLLDFRDAYPEIAFEIYESTADSLIDLLKNEIVEIALFRERKGLHPLLEHVLPTDERLMLVYCRENPWLSDELTCVPIAMLKDVPLSTPKGLRHIITEMCSNAGFTPDFMCVSTSRFTATSLCKRGKAVAILPVRNAKDYDNADQCCRPFDDSDMVVRRSFHYLKGRNLSAVAKTFLEFYNSRQGTMD